jgi:peptide/nickel transport system ATP-binding protein
MTSPGKNPVEVRDLTIRLRRPDGNMDLVNGVSFDLAAGEVLGVIGESGAGKSLMLRSLLGMHPAAAEVGGTVRIFGRDLAAMPQHELAALRGRTVSMIFQEPSTALDPVFTVGAQIAETVMRHQGLSHRAAWLRALELLDMVAIPSAARRLRSFPHELSGGTRQRVMIALALSCRPGVLLADEPTTALDATVQIQLLLLLRRLQRELGMSVVFVTHDMAVAAEISDRVAVMYAGRFVEAGPVEPVLLAPRHPYTVGLLRSSVHAGMRGSALRTIPGSHSDPRELPPGCAFAPRCEFAEDRCHRASPAPVGPAAAHQVSCWLS